MLKFRYFRACTTKPKGLYSTYALVLLLKSHNNNMDVNNNYVWLDKKVYLETNSGRKYVGKVINETDNDILILDIKNHHVQLSKDEIKLIQEEF